MHIRSQISDGSDFQMEGGAGDANTKSDIQPNSSDKSSMNEAEGQDKKKYESHSKGKR